MSERCPTCGHKKQEYMMSVDPDAPGLTGLWKGEGDPFMQIVAKLGTLIIVFLLVLGLLVSLHISL